MSLEVRHRMNGPEDVERGIARHENSLVPSGLAVLLDLESDSMVWSGDDKGIMKALLHGCR